MRDKQEVEIVDFLLQVKDCLVSRHIPCVYPVTSAHYSVIYLPLTSTIDKSVTTVYSNLSSPYIHFLCITAPSLLLS